MGKVNIGIKGMKLIHCVQVYDISFYMNFVSYYCYPCGFIAMVTYHRLIKEQVEISFISVLH